MLDNGIDPRMRPEKNIIAVLMQGYQSFEIIPWVDELPQDRMYGMYRCMTKDFSTYKVFENKKYRMNNLVPIFMNNKTQELGGFNMC